MIIVILIVHTFFNERIMITIIQEDENRPSK
jgi:hypothetical protein